MSSMKVKHHKIRNTGLLFEFLLRQVTADMLNKTQRSIAINILKQRFNERTELGKEFALYNILTNKTFKSDKKADFFIQEALRVRCALDNSQLKREKYNLIKHIKEHFDLKTLLSSKIPSYKLYASIYKLFEHYNNLSPEEKTESYFIVLENLTTKKQIQLSEVAQHNLPDNEDLRIITYRILLEKFNEKYSHMNTKQKTLLKEYIYNVSNTNSLQEYINSEIPQLRKALRQHVKKIDDKITKIKLNEAIKSIAKFCKTTKVVKDSSVIQMMRYYELLKTLDKQNG